LQVSIKEKNADVTCEPLPTITVNPTQMVQLLQNLISNALKFCKSDVPPKIRLSAKKEGGYWVFSVSDNGIGINPEYFNKIFHIFQRLQSEYEGTGIGLAVCKKIVEYHKGKIWVESQLNEGTAFYFTIPA
jgi:light-regulated signal transduction histidine kinase (bacteriophytochrome)